MASKKRRVGDQVSAASSPETSRGGRPTKLTPGVAERIAQLIATGVPMSVACRAEHVAARTLRDWRARADGAVEPYATLFARLDAAQASADGAIAASMFEAALRDWRAAAWWLERRVPELFSATKQTVRLEQAHAVLNDAELDAALASYGYVRAPKEADAAPSQAASSPCPTIASE